MRKKLLRQLFLVTLPMVFAFACVNDDPFDDSGRRGNAGNRQPIVLSPEAIAARAWFEDKVGKTFLAWYGGNDERMMLMPHWSHAVTNENDRFRVTEVRMRVRGTRDMVRVMSQNSQRFEATGNRRYLIADTRFVLRTDIETGETVGFVMKVNPDVEQVGRNRRQHPLRGFTYLERERDFTGFVTFYDLNGEFVNGWRQRGREFTPIFTRGMISEHGLPPQLRSSVCCGDCPLCMFECWVWTLFIPILNDERQTIGWIIITEVDRDSCVWTHCRSDGGGSGGGSSGGGGSGGGGSTGGSNGGFNSPSAIMPNENPCRDGRSGAQANQSFLNNPAMQEMHQHFWRVSEMNLLALQDNTSIPYPNEFGMTIGRDANGNFVTSYMREGVGASVTMPPTPPGTERVAIVHNHIAANPVPNAHDLYTFFTYVERYPTLQTMYIYGLQFDIATGTRRIEIFAINVHDRNAVLNFLNKFPRSENLSGGRFYGEMSTNWENANELHNENMRNLSPNPPHRDAAVLSYLMQELNMGVTLSRRIRNGSFHMIDVQRAANGNGLVFSICN